MGANIIQTTPTSVRWDQASPRCLKATEEEAGGQARRNQINITINGDWAAGGGGGGEGAGAWISCHGGKSLSITAQGGTGPEETNLRGDVSRTHENFAVTKA